jgi:predicted DNA-binding WGR domain protein
MFTVLKRVDPAEAMDRWYLVAVQPTLLDEVALVIGYGSRHTMYQRLRTAPFASEAEARQAARELVAAKIKRGYVIAMQME